MTQPSYLNSTRRIVIFMLIGTLMVSLPAFLILDVPPDAKDYLLIVLGWFTAKGSDAIAYLLGSTEASSLKTQAMVDLASRPQGAPPAAKADEFAIPPPPDPAP